MDVSGFLFGLVLVAGGLSVGYLHGRQHNIDELETLRGIVRDNQKRNLERIEAMRGKQRNDEAQ